MKTTNLILITIIAEDELESRLVEDLKKLGVVGYTIQEVRGGGLHGLLRESHWEGDNVKIEIIVDDALADVVTDHISKDYFPFYGTILYMRPIQVLRGDKFTKP